LMSLGFSSTVLTQVSSITLHQRATVCHGLRPSLACRLDVFVYFNVLYYKALDMVLHSLDES
jgi:hypothetical protein